MRPFNFNSLSSNHRLKNCTVHHIKHQACWTTHHHHHHTWAWESKTILLTQTQNTHTQKLDGRCDSPYCRRFRPLHFQVVVFFLRLEVCKNDGDGVSGISKYGPRTVRTIVIFTREIGTRNDATWTPQSITTCVLSCQPNTKRLLLGIGLRWLHKVYSRKWQLNLRGHLIRIYMYARFEQGD